MTPMAKSLILAAVLFICWAIIVYTYELAYELAIRPLSKIKRRSIQKKTIKKLDKNQEGGKKINSVEIDHKTMKNLNKIIFKFNFKYAMTSLFFLVATVFVLANTRLDDMDVLIFLVIGNLIVYIIAKLQSTRESVKQISYPIIKKFLKLSDEYMQKLKED
ncbi:MAG: hypothetical protein MJ246_08725 [Clostridia bacterium]|nr:hypothetical protein [Clostridia bacterium]